MNQDILLFNGKIHTIDENNRIVPCVAIEKGKYVYIGEYDKSVYQKHESYIKIDLKGKTVLPGFVDAHMHMKHYARSYYGVNLAGYNDVYKYKEILNKYFQENKNAKSIYGSGWLEVLSPKGLLKEDLDEISKDIPIVLYADSFHSIWVNSKTLEIAGINKNTRDIEDGIIERNEEGEPSGTLREKWVDIVMDCLPDYSVEEYIEAFMSCASILNSLGIIGIFDACLDADSNAIEAFKELAKEDKLPLYVRGSYMAYPQKGSQQIDKFVRCREKDKVNENFFINTVKLYEDGVVEGKTAYLLEPYEDNQKENQNYTSSPLWTQEQLNEIVKEITKNNFQTHIHCIGDAAVSEVINAFEYAQKEKGCKQNRNIIAHIELIQEKDYERFKELGLLALLNPYWAEVDDLYFSNLERLGIERTKQTWPINSFMKRNIICGAGSDFPVTDVPNPFNGIEMGITRTISKYYHPWAQEYETKKYNFALGCDSEKASIDDMVRMFTQGAAYTTLMDDITGSIEIGKNADFIVLDQDIYNIPHEEITNTKIISTYRKGKKIY